MKDVGIITLWGNVNYGNRLQNLAVEQLVADYGFRPHTLTFVPQSSNNKIKSQLNNILEYFQNPKLNIRRKAFDQFNKLYLHPLNMKYQSKCEMLICGSDQIWNYTFPEFSPEMFLSFANGRRTCSLSASFGVSNIPDELQSFYSEMLSGIDYLSVREDKGKELINEICGDREVEVLIDPTMAVGRRKWEKLTSNIRVDSDQFVFCYFLGRKPDDLDGKIKRELDCRKTIHFNDKKYPQWFVADPLSFVANIAGSKAVITDSFHGVVFSMLFGKPFVVYDRNTDEKSMSSRITTILKKFKMENNHINRISSFGECTKPNEEFLRILKEEQSKVQSFLSKAFEGIED